MMFKDGRQQLRVPTPQESINRPDVTKLRDKISWTRPPVMMVADLSGMNYKHNLSKNMDCNVSGLYLSRIDLGVLFGQHHFHAAIDSNNHFFTQDISNYLGRLDFHLKNHPGRNLPIPQIFLEGNEYTIDYSLLGSRVIEVPTSVVFGSPTEPGNWGMWLLQALPIIDQFRRDKLSRNILIHAGSEWQRRLLATLDVQSEAVTDQRLGRAYFCRELYLYQYDAITFSVSDSNIETFERLVDELAPDASFPHRKIFISRRSITTKSGTAYRALIEEDELTEALKSEGFEIVEPELLSFSDQVRIFREAYLVVGLGGAGMFNTVFCKPGTKVISIESSLAFVDNHAELFSSMKHRVGFIIGEKDLSDFRAVHGRWHIDVVQAKQLIAAF